MLRLQALEQLAGGLIRFSLGPAPNLGPCRFKRIFARSPPAHFRCWLLLSRSRRAILPRCFQRCQVLLERCRLPLLSGRLIGDFKEPALSIANLVATATPDRAAPAAFAA